MTLERLAGTEVKAWCAKIRHLGFGRQGEPWKGCKQEKALGLCCARTALRTGVTKARRRQGQHEKKEARGELG